MLSLYFTIGVIWSVYTLIRNSQNHKYHREHWFPAGFFSFLLWPILMWTAYGNGFIQYDYKKLKGMLK